MVPPAAKTFASEGTPFRDDLGSAHERISRLEQENQGLRAELARLKSPPPHSPPAGRHTTLVVALAGTCFVLVAFGAYVAMRAGPQRSSIPVAAPGMEPVPTVARPGDCAQPWFIDAKGNRVFRKDCL